MTKVIIAELAVAPPEGEEVLVYFSDEPMPPFAPDDPDRANQAYDPRLIDAANISIDVFSDFSRLSGTVAGGAMVVSNNDGALSYLRGYGVVSVGIYWGEKGAPFASFIPLLKGRCASPNWQIAARQPGRLIVPLYDKRADLDTLIPVNLYAGTNDGGGSGYEGTADGLKDKPKPLALGDLTQANIPAVWANAEDLVAQVHDGEMEGITEIRNGGGDAGLSLSAVSTGATFDAATPDEDEYEEDRTRGFVKFGGTLAGEVTFCLKGANDGGYDDTAGPLMVRLLKIAGVDDGDIGASFTALEAPMKCGLYIADQRPAWQDAEMLGRSIGGWCLPDHLGIWQVGKLTVPGEPDLILTDDDLLDISVDGNSPTDPVWRVTCLYARNYRVLGRSELQGEVLGTAQETAVGLAWRSAIAKSDAVKARFPYARELELETALIEEADASALAELMLDIFGPREDGSPKRLLSVVLQMTEEVLSLPFGSAIQVIYERDGLDVTGLLLGRQPTSLRRNLVTLKVFG